METKRKVQMRKMTVDELALHLLATGQNKAVDFTLATDKDAEAWPPWYELRIRSFCGPRCNVLEVNDGQGEPQSFMLREDGTEYVAGILKKLIAGERRKYRGTTEEIITPCTPEELWAEFGDVPMDPETECIESGWNGFEAGTHREEIWRWFEEYFGISVYSLMYPQRGDQTYPEMETPFPYAAVSSPGYVLGVRDCANKGYNPGKWMLPISKGDAKRLWDIEAPVEICALCGDGTESIVKGEDDLDKSEIFGAALGDVIEAFYGWLDS